MLYNEYSLEECPIKPAFTWSKSTVEHQNNVWNLFTVNNKDTGRTSMASFWCLNCYLWTDFTHCSGVSIVDLEQVNAAWVVLVSLKILTEESERRFQQSCKVTLLKSHFDMGVLLWICCIFSEHLFLRTPLDGCYMCYFMLVYQKWNLYCYAKSTNIYFEKKTKNKTMHLKMFRKNSILLVLLNATLLKTHFGMGVFL